MIKTVPASHLQRTPEVGGEICPGHGAANSFPGVIEPQSKLELLASLLKCAVAVALLAVALTCQSGLDALLLARLQIESVPLNFLNDVFLENFTFKAS